LLGSDCQTCCHFAEQFQKIQELKSRDHPEVEGTSEYVSISAACPVKSALIRLAKISAEASPTPMFLVKKIRF